MEILNLGLTLGTLQVLIAFWLRARLEASIKHEYDRVLEEIKYDVRVREQAASIAELFAEWNSDPVDRKRLNQLTWEASLWLPTDIVRDVSRRLSNSVEAKDVKDILLSVRALLQKKTDDLKASELVHFQRV
jgi:hypothetical protein